MTYKSLSIIIPNYNGEELLPMFFPYLIGALKLYNGKHEIIIVDDCSKDNSKSVLRNLEQEYSFVKVFFNDRNLGFSGTCNVGIKEAQYDIMFFFNNDVKIEPDYFNYFSTYFDDPDVFALTTCAYYYGSGKPLDGIKTAYWKRGLPRVTENIFNPQILQSQVAPPYRSFAVQGAYFFADSVKVRQLNGFDELFNPYVYEETDLSYRALKRGWKILYEPKCIGYHKLNTSIDKVSDNYTKLMISQRNRIIFIWKNIDYTPYLISNLFFMTVKLMRFDKVYFEAIRQTVRLWPEIKKRRLIEKKESVKTDNTLFREFGTYQKQFKRKHLL